jgi:hypothetical protein
MLPLLHTFVMWSLIKLSDNDLSCTPDAFFAVLNSWLMYLLFHCSEEYFAAVTDLLLHFQWAAQITFYADKVNEYSVHYNYMEANMLCCISLIVHEI